MAALPPPPQDIHAQQGEGENDWPIRRNYETAVAAVVAYAKTRSDIDADRMGLWGVSLGGYYAPRSAAFVPGFKGCIALSGPYDWGEAWDGLPALTREAFRARSKSATMEAARDAAATLTLEGVADKLELGTLAEVADRKDRPEDRLQPLLGTAAFGLVHHEELVVGLLLHLDEVRHLRHLMDAAEHLPQTLMTVRSLLRHVGSSQSSKLDATAHQTLRAVLRRFW